MNLTQFSVKNYQFTLLGFLMIVVIGIVTLLSMPRAEDPQINPPSYIITVVYPGTSPKDLEELVVNPIENRVYSLGDIDKLNAKIENGVAIIFVDFKYGVSVETKYQDIIREVNAIRSSLSSDISYIDIYKADPSDVNILQVALMSENASFRQLKDEAEKLKENLEKIIDLKHVKISGAPEEEVRIDLQLNKLAALKIPLNVVLGSIQSETLNIPGGSVSSGTQSFNIKTSGKYIDLSDIENTVIYNGNGKLIYLKDVASVSFKNQTQTHITRLNGHRSVLVHAAQKAGGNISQTQKKYLQTLTEFEAQLPPNIKLVKHFDQADNVHRRLYGLGKDFLFAIGLVLLTLAPLGLRASIIVMIAIPLSLALGLVGLNAFGISLNQLSIVGMVVSLGLLVDDSIVVVENIERWLREGHTRRQAAILATKQITLAVIGCTATLIIAFLPLIFLPAAPGEFIRGLPLAVITSVLASMIVSLTVVPFLASLFLKEKNHHQGNFFLRALQNVIDTTYSKAMKTALKKPIKTLSFVFALFIASMSLFPFLGFKLFPASEKPIFLINIKPPIQTNLEESNRIAKMIEDSLRQFNSIEYFTTNVGKGNPQIYYNVLQQEQKNDFVQIFVQLKINTKPKQKVKLINELRDQLADFPFAKIEVKDFEQGPPIEAPISIRVFGENLDTLRQLSFEVEKVLNKHPGTLYVTNELNTLKSDIKIHINRDKARSLGILTADIDRLVRLAVAGLGVGVYTNEEGDDFEIVVGTSRGQFSTLKSLENIYVNSALGAPVPLNQVTRLEFETSPSSINHFNKNRFVKVTSYTKANVLANDVLKETIPLLEKIKMPAGYHYKLSGEAESEGDAFGSGFMSVIISTVFLFVAVLILQFKSFKGLLIVLSVIPLGMIGGVSMLWLTGNPMSFIAIIGFIGLAGIEVKNSILLVDFTNQLRREGVELHAAIEKAGAMRFLPVVLTSLTAIGGLIPLAVSTNPIISPLAWVLIGGLISSTLFSRIITPVMYLMFPPEIEKI